MGAHATTPIISNDNKAKDAECSHGHTRDQAPTAPAKGFWLSQLHIWIDGGFLSWNTGSMKSLPWGHAMGESIPHHLPELSALWGQDPGRQPELGKLNPPLPFFFTGDVLVTRGLLGRG